MPETKATNSDLKREFERVGGDAFPRPMVGSSEHGTVDFGAPGMTMLDYFAGQALAAHNLHGAHHQQGRETIAQMAYDVAQTMLAERNRRYGR